MYKVDTEILIFSELGHLLSLLYLNPDEKEKISSTLEQLEKISSYTNDRTIEIIDKLILSFNNIQPLKLRVDHAALFVGPYQLLAYPYGSVHLEKNKQVMGETTIALKQLYMKAGLCIDDNINEIPDHISLELEFLHYLLYKLSENFEDKQILELLSNFLKQYYLPFTNKFLTLVVENAETDFYKALGNLHIQYNESICSFLEFD